MKSTYFILGLEKLFFYARHSICEEGVDLIMKKVSLRIEDENLEVLMTLCKTENVSEAVRIAILFYLQNNDGLENVKTLFPYIGKKPPRIGREVVEAFRQSGCSIFVDLFCGSLAMLCYLPCDTKVVVNDINGNLTNLYQVIRDKPSAFVHEVMRLPYSEVLFRQFSEKLKSDTNMTDMERAIACYYVSFGAYRGRMGNPIIRISLSVDSNMATAYQKNLKWILQLSRRLQTVEILNRDFRYVLKQYNSKDIFVYADCPYLGTENYYDNVFTPKDHEDLASMLKSHKGRFALSSKAKKELRKLYRSNNHYVLEFEDTCRLPDKRHREQLIMNFEMKHVNKYGEIDVKPYQ